MSGSAMRRLLLRDGDINSRGRTAGWGANQWSKTGSKELEYMIGLVQRVAEAEVSVAGRTVARIGRGILVLVGVERDDAAADAERLAQRILTYRVFADEDGRMNRSVLDLGLEVLLVPQFTLAADTGKGTRASFTRAAAPEAAQPLFEHLLVACGKRLRGVAGGEFGANMQVSLVNDGPVTFWLET